MYDIMKQQPVIVWNFDQTLFDPITKMLIPGAKSALEYTKNAGYKNLLYGQSKRPDTLRSLIHETGIAPYFTDIFITKEKDVKEIFAFVKSYTQVVYNSFLVSNDIREDGALGNILGVRTIWFKYGSFKHDLPREYHEEPVATVETFSELKSLIHPVKKKFDIKICQEIYKQ